MDKHQLAFEHGVGDAFVAWFNALQGRRFAFFGRPAEAPDLTYRDGSDDLHLEIAGAYYDAQEAALWWGAKRGVADAPRTWSGKDMDEMLISNINQRLTEKCAKSYGSNCRLVIYVHPLITTAEDLELLLRQVRIPVRNPFSEIYLTGFFPASSAGSRGGYYVWKLA